jgi:hypothetical protein
MQAQRVRATGAGMIRSRPVVALLATLASVSSAKGPVDTIDRGRYVCELPGDAAGQAGRPQPDRNFTVEAASRYSSPQGQGTYLRRGDRVDMTSGPRKGEAYRIVREGFLKLLEPDGTPSRLRCVLES